MDVSFKIMVARIKPQQLHQLILNFLGAYDNMQGNKAGFKWRILYGNCKNKSAKLAHINKANQPFEIIGKLKPAFANGIWTYTEEIYEQSNMKAYPDNTWDYAAYINNPDKTIFLAYSGAECVGQLF